MQTETAISPTAPAPGTLLRRSWAMVMIFCGLGLTGIWVALLGYGLLGLMAL